MSEAFDVDVQFTGPLSVPGKSDQIFAKGMKSIRGAFAARGVEVVAEQLYRPNHGYVTGRLKDSIAGNIKKNIVVIESDPFVIYAPWVEGVSSRNTTSRFKGYQMFRKGKDILEKEKKKIVEDEMRHLVRELGG